MGIIILFSVLLASCKKETESDPKITIIIKNDNPSFSIAGNGSLTIDWGDGTKIETHTLQPYNINWPHGENFSYNYAELLDEHTITLTSKGISYFRYLGLISLDLSSINTLVHLSCWGCGITSLDLSNNTSLYALELVVNKLKSLDLSKNFTLAKLNCEGNQLTSLDLSNNGLLYEVNCSHNNLSVAALNALFETLHDHDYSAIYIQKNIRIGNNPGTDGCDKSIATEKGWEVIAD